MTERANMTFIDLFAGIGGFHIALEKLGHTCVFASEIDPLLQQSYKTNFNLTPYGDITKIDIKNIPTHDILCAGFPCQPFSKAGERKGVSDIRGQLLYKVEAILKDHTPKYFILENVVSFKTSDLFTHFTKEMRNLYDIQDIIVSPDEFGIPQHRPRVFILGIIKNTARNFDIKKFVPLKTQWGFTEDQCSRDERLVEPDKLAVIELWQKIIDDLTLNSDDEIYSPLWTTEYKATYPFITEAPINVSPEILSNYRGSYGSSLEGLDKNSQMNILPRYARTDMHVLPDWKIRFIKNSREFCSKNSAVFDKYLPELKKMNLSHQKLEWNVKGGVRNLKEHIIQFRPSGIRVSRRDRFPSLVSINLTQIPIIFDGFHFRYITNREALALQSFPLDLILPNEHSKAFKALGNAINTEIAYQLIKYIIEL